MELPPGVLQPHADIQLDAAVAPLTRQDVQEGQQHGMEQQLCTRQHQEQEQQTQEQQVAACPALGAHGSTAAAAGADTAAGTAAECIQQGRIELGSGLPVRAHGALVPEVDAEVAAAAAELATVPHAAAAAGGAAAANAAVLVAAAPAMAVEHVAAAAALPVPAAAAAAGRKALGKQSRGLAQLLPSTPPKAARMDAGCISQHERQSAAEQTQPRIQPALCDMSRTDKGKKRSMATGAAPVASLPKIARLCAAEKEGEMQQAGSSPTCTRSKACEATQPR